MKKTVALALAALSAGIIWFMGHSRAKEKTISFAPLESLRTTDDTLLVCRNLRTTYVKNSWGNLQIKAATGSVTRDHAIRATSVQVTLTQATSPLTTITAEHATLAARNHQLTLEGAVHAQQDNTLVDTDALKFDWKNRVATAMGNVKIKHPQGKLTTDKATFDHQLKIFTADGHVQSEFGRKT
jgi:lipopolysaccharide export system protein LptA